MTSQAEAFLTYFDGEQLECTILMRDLDGKFSADFDACFSKQGMRVKPVGSRAPNLNAFVERWIQSLKHEALNHFVVFGRKHFDHIVREYVTYYLKYRPHQGIGNRLIGNEAQTASVESVTVESIQCESRLGGLLKHYHRAA
jgi:putative transposase